MSPDEKLRRCVVLLSAIAGMSDRTIECVIPQNVRRQARETLDQIGEPWEERR